jgi:hypothetical protein
MMDILTSKKRDLGITSHASHQWSTNSHRPQPPVWPNADYSLGNPQCKLASAIDEMVTKIGINFGYSDYEYHQTGNTNNEYGSNYENIHISLRFKMDAYGFCGS